MVTTSVPLTYLFDPPESRITLVMFLSQDQNSCDQPNNEQPHTPVVGLILVNVLLTLKQTPRGGAKAALSKKLSFVSMLLAREYVQRRSSPLQN